ncbi:MULTISPECIES: TetR/AcrR family transcriptional regulator [unclassified Frondihabitans]|uniref:TetR/AcrR family transcriptional regulator n=1 Tax=unclassified Frondihabitans TaxID=2626248 RepID=UPI000F50D90D|nr:MULTISPECIES: TetR/AcrR family transcriptional regulator [unclassified Frondihabitans]
MNSTSAAPTTETRMSAADRREQILDVATGLFGDRGFHGTTTDQVAQAAGISQPYVVRMFGTKEKLFLEVLDRALGLLLQTFRRILESPAGDDDRPMQARLGSGYVDLLGTRGVHRTLLHAFVSGNDPVIGAAARRGFVDIYRFLRDEAKFTPAEVEVFLSQGMLFSVLLGIELPAAFGQDSDADELMQVAFADKCGVVLEMAGPGTAR